MAWLNASDAPKEKEPPPLVGGDKKGRGAALWRSDSFDDEPVTVGSSRAGGTPIQLGNTWEATMMLCDSAVPLFNMKN